jgi:hypothetical protein
MRPRSAAILAIRVIALVFGIEAVTALIQFLILTADIRAGGGTGSFWATLLTRLLIAVALWRFAGDLSRPMSHGTDDEPPLAARRTVNVAAVAFSVVGVIMLSNAAIEFVSTLANPNRFGLPISPLSLLRLTGPAPGFFDGRGAAIVVELVKFAVGLALVLASGNLARALSKLYPESEPPAAPPTGDAPPSA